MTSKEKCCGCTACFHVCPSHCITMKEDEEGFLYPVIEKENCIYCHKCEKVCPVQNTDHLNTKTETFVGYSKNDEIRNQSSSGGIFSSIAEWILQQNGVVFGAAFDENFEVHHIAIESKDELEKLRGSKYVQSRLENVYPEAKQYLELKRAVLFTGTACQIAGLKKYLNKEYKNLYTVDVLCHGVPSPKIWRMYLAEKKKQYHAEIKKIEFRNKKNGWKNFSVKMDFVNKQQYCVHFFKDQYMRMFLDNIDLRSLCYQCHFKEIPRISDITIGDSWGIEELMPDMDDNKGTSVILVHSAKGDWMLQAIEESLKVREAKLDEVLPPTADSRKSVEKHPNRIKYLKGVKKGESFDVLYGYVQKNLLQRTVGCMRYIVKRVKREK